MSTLAIFLLASVIAVLCGLGFLLLETRASWRDIRALKDDINELAQTVRLGPSKLLVINIEKVRPGDGMDQVQRFLGIADNPSDEEWVYYLDRDSGYVIRFDGNQRVERVNSWKS